MDPASLDLVALTSADAARLADFFVPGYDPWVMRVDSMVRAELAPWLDHGVEALALADNGDLACVVAWEPDHDDPSIWRCHALATKLKYRENGCARHLKTHLLEHAHANGARAVVSTVDYRNSWMLGLNRYFDADIQDDPDDEKGQMQVCTIRLPWTPPSN